MVINRAVPLGGKNFLGPKKLALNVFFFFFGKKSGVFFLFKNMFFLKTGVSDFSFFNPWRYFFGPILEKSQAVFFFDFLDFFLVFFDFFDFFLMKTTPPPMFGQAVKRFWSQKAGVKFFCKKSKKKTIF